MVIEPIIVIIGVIIADRKGFIAPEDPKASDTLDKVYTVKPVIIPPKTKMFVLLVLM